jgi:hypothetical protein
MAATLPSIRQAGGNVDRRKDLISPKLKLLEQFRKKCPLDEDQKTIDSLTFLVVNLSTEEHARADLLVDYCRSHALEVTDFV